MNEWVTSWIMMESTSYWLFRRLTQFQFNVSPSEMPQKRNKSETLEQVVVINFFFFHYLVAPYLIEKLCIIFLVNKNCAKRIYTISNSRTSYEPELMTSLFSNFGRQDHFKYGFYGRGFKFVKLHRIGSDFSSLENCVLPSSTLTICLVKISLLFGWHLRRSYDGF